MESTRVHKRFVRWLEDTGLTQRAAANLLGQSATFISDICAGKRWPGRRLANDIERESAAWKKGPIRSEEWDEAESAIQKATGS